MPIEENEAEKPTLNRIINQIVYNTIVSECDKKKCPKCGSIRLKKDFSKCKRYKDGLQTHCKSCSKAYYDANKIKFERRYQANKVEIAKKYAAAQKSKPENQKAKRNAREKAQYDSDAGYRMFTFFEGVL